MTEHALDPFVANLDRRQLLMRVLFGSVGAAGLAASHPKPKRTAGAESFLT
jgi:hypothetical protein